MGNPKTERLRRLVRTSKRFHIQNLKRFPSPPAPPHPSKTININTFEVIRTLNKQKGNMYGFVTHTWNPIKGKCAHDCEYCYMKKWGHLKDIRLEKKELQTDLGEGNFIFVGSSTDMWAYNIPIGWIRMVLEYCNRFPNNKYLFQTKNPIRFQAHLNTFPKDTVLCTTMETNRSGHAYNAASVSQRQWHIQQDKFPVMITIEPIMDFDIDIMVNWIRDISPFQVNIGADSCGHNLPEPSKEKIQSLITALYKFTKVIQKPNLNRLLKQK